jgi:RNA polymerase sporulation-specific sigma factor
VNTFRSDKNIKLATYASRCIENEILMYFRKVSGKQEVSLDEPLNTDWDGGELLLSDVLGSDEVPIGQEIEDAEERLALRRAVARLESRERLIVELRFGLNGRREMTQSEVAELLGISQSYISRLEKKILRKLRRELEGV